MTDQIMHKREIGEVCYHTILDQFVTVTHRYYPEINGVKHYDRPLYYVEYDDMFTDVTYGEFVTAEHELIL